MHVPSTASNHAKGLTFGILGVLLLSPDTLIIRLVDADPWTFIAWRGGLMTVGVMVIMVLRFGVTVAARTYAIGWLGLLIALLFAVNNVFFQLSVQNTTVANTLVILATAPLFAALFSVAFLREQVPRRTWIAAVFSALGICVVFIGELQTENLFGNVAALISAVGLGIYFVLVRLGRPVDMSPAIGIAGIFVCLIGAGLASDLYLEPRQFGLLAVLGLILLPLSFVFLTRAPHYISAPEVSLVLLIETILGPLWVWIAITEEPPLQTIAGGGLIIIVLAIHAALSLRESRRLAKAVLIDDTGASPATNLAE
jgi:drug/metabolite transporter (DMT)-like permease